MPPTEYYTNNLYGKFIRTPVVWDPNLGDNGDIDQNAEYDDPKDVFPDTYVDYIQILYGKDTKRTTSSRIDLIPSSPAP